MTLPPTHVAGTTRPAHRSGDTSAAEGDRFGARVARRAHGVLRAFNEAGVLAAADVHVATRLAALAGDGDEAVALAVALAVRAPRLGHVCADLATARRSVTTEAAAPVDLQALPWPDQDTWAGRVAASPVVAAGAGGPDHRPVRLEGTQVYLDRYWRQERRVAADLLARAADEAAGVDPAVLAGGLDRLFPPAGEGPDLQRLAAATAVLRRLAVVAGGPGTGKTTTVAAVLALLDEQAAAAGARPPRMALAAPTGKAAARLEEAVHQQAARLPVADATRARLLALDGSTLHRLLGWRPSGPNRFRHHGGNRLPHDVVVVDETSMVSLSMLASLVDAVGTSARLVLVGDPGQLASVEAGAVLGDVVGPAASGLRMRPAARAALAAAAGGEVRAADAPPGVVVGDGIVVLRRVHRYGGRLAHLAEAVHRADADGAVSVLADGGDEVRWLDADVAETGAALAPVRQAVVGAGAALRAAALAGDGRAALHALGGLRVLCAHRRGPYGVDTWTAVAERWLRDADPTYGAAPGGRWYAGQPLLVTENDYALRLFNGDTGVVVARGDRLTAVFERRGQLFEVSPARLQAVETVHAMTVHKSQGSQFDEVAVLLPEPGSPILTRELLYTAVTRARRRLTVAGPESSIRAAVAHPVARASGLARRLWSPPLPST
ncbi:MAG TPA: exodeoxyribonuclease V subunit alpha [Acidimicrobiales bacterium]|nr:exodeoxyribonuclease V subunit alpha [Acidimicrobiales bacterium]